jgi:hypothetical protein
MTPVALDVINKVRMCSVCEQCDKNWSCQLTKESIFLQQICPLNLWDKGIFPMQTSETPPELLEPQNRDEAGALKVENFGRGAFPAYFKKRFVETRPHKNLLTPQSSVDDVLYCVKHFPSGGWMSECYKWENFKEAHRRLCAETARKIITSEYPSERFKGKGIVVCGGGPKYYPSLYVNLRLLRLIGCQLPVEVYYIGRKEMDFKMIEILESIENVKCIDAVSLEAQYPIRTHGGWESKVYSIINSSFEEVLFMDADNTALRNPEYLFQEPEYLKHGAVLWPDYDCWVHDKNMWKILGMEYSDEPQIESGQVLVNKKECWHQINMAKYFCDYSDFYFKLFYGDKEAFHFGWRFLGANYGQPGKPDWVNDCIIAQKDFSGSWLFSHRAQSKFKMDKSHKITIDMPYESDTLELIDELNEIWKGGVWINYYPSSEEKSLADKTVGKYQYIRVGIDQRLLELLPDNKIGAGSARLEKHWHIFIRGEKKVLALHGESGLTALLEWNGKKWAGRWLDYEKCEVELI